MTDWLKHLLETEARYHTNIATLKKTDCAWFLHNAELADYRSANHALRLRDDGRGPEAVAREVVAFYRRLGLPPTADVDEIAEQQGIGSALRRLGVTPIFGDTLYMVYSHLTPRPPLPDVRLGSLGEGESFGLSLPLSCEPPLPNPPLDKGRARWGGRGGRIQVESMTRVIFSDAVQEWIDLVASEEAGTENENFWRDVITREAGGEGRTLYLARLDGQAVGACHLFTANGWGRIDDVFVRPEFRRRGVASALIVRTLTDSETMGHSETYLFTEAGGMAEPLYRKLGFTVRAVNPLQRHIAS